MRTRASSRSTSRRRAALPGVKAVVTATDFPEQANRIVPAGEMQVNLRDVTRNVMAREKVLYRGPRRRRRRRDQRGDRASRRSTLIKVDYEVLPHVIDVDEAMKPGAPILHDDIRTEGVQPAPTKPSNIAKRVEFVQGRRRKRLRRGRRGRSSASSTPQPVHQGYIEPHACLASGGRGRPGRSSGRRPRATSRCAASAPRCCSIETSQIRVTPSEIGGGFGGKTVVYLEPVAIALSQKAGKPVKMVMTREEVFRASGPTSGAHVA